MYQYIQGWKVDEAQFDWMYKHDDWNTALDLFGEKVWIKIEAKRCVVKSLWGLFKSGMIGKLGKGYYSYYDDNVCYIVYRFGWCWNSDQDWPTKTMWDFLIDKNYEYPTPQKIKPNLKYVVDKSCEL